MTEIYLHIVARMADYMDTHPYLPEGNAFGFFNVRLYLLYTTDATCSKR